MNKIFGSKKPTQPVVQTRPEPVMKGPPTDLNVTTKKIEMRIQELNGQISVIDAQLKEQYPKMKSAKGNQQNYYKQRVLTLMKKRKMYQQQVDNLLGQQFSLERVNFTKENIQNTIDTTKALKDATIMQREIMKQIDVDDVADLRDEMEDMQFESNQINDMLGRDFAVDFDEGDLDAELRELEDEVFIEAIDKKVQPQKQNQRQVQKDDNSISQILNSNI